MRLIISLNKGLILDLKEQNQTINSSFSEYLKVNNAYQMMHINKK